MRTRTLIALPAAAAPGSRLRAARRRTTATRWPRRRPAPAAPSASATPEPRRSRRSAPSACASTACRWRTRRSTAAASARATTGASTTDQAEAPGGVQAVPARRGAGPARSTRRGDGARVSPVHARATASRTSPTRTRRPDLRRRRSATDPQYRAARRPATPQIADRLARSGDRRETTSRPGVPARRGGRRPVAAAVVLVAGAAAAAAPSASAPRHRRRRPTPTCRRRTAQVTRQTLLDTEEVTATWATAHDHLAGRIAGQSPGCRCAGDVISRGKPLYGWTTGRSC